MPEEVGLKNPIVYRYQSTSGNEVKGSNFYTKSYINTKINLWRFTILRKPSQLSLDVFIASLQEGRHSQGQVTT